MHKFTGEFAITVATRDRIEAFAVLSAGGHVISPTGLKEWFEREESRIRTRRDRR